MNRRDFLNISLPIYSALAMSPSLLSSFKVSNPKILLHTGWNTNNIGDQGHTPGTLRYLEQHFPEAKIICWLNSTNEETNQILKRRFPKIEIIMGNLDKYGKADNPTLQQAFDKADLVIQNSGMSFNSFWKPPSILEACNRNQKLLCNYGQSFDGFKKEDEPHMVEELSKIFANYCRDNESYYYLRKIGVKSTILAWGPDGCFGIDVKNDEKAIRYLEEHGLEEKKFITVIMRTNTSDKKPEELPSWDVGDTSQNPWNPTQEDAEQDEFWAEKLREVIIAWVEKTGLKVFLASEVKKEIYHSKRLIYDRLPAHIQGKVIHKAEWWNMDEACSIFSRAHTLVATEPHSLIMALANNTPIIHLFSKRHGLKAWMFRDIGLPEWLIDIDSEPAETAIRSLMDIYHNYGNALTKVKRAIEMVEKRSAEIIGDIKRKLS